MSIPGFRTYSSIGHNAIVIYMPVETYPLKILSSKNVALLIRLSIYSIKTLLQFDTMGACSQKFANENMMPLYIFVM